MSDKWCPYCGEAVKELEDCNLELDKAWNEVRRLKQELAIATQRTQRATFIGEE
jgi:hypothetical protein